MTEPSGTAARPCCRPGDPKPCGWPDMDCYVNGPKAPNTAASGDVLTNEQLDERIKRLMRDMIALQPELAQALGDAVWLRHGIDI